MRKTVADKRRRKFQAIGGHTVISQQGETDCLPLIFSNQETRGSLACVQFHKCKLIKILCPKDVVIYLLSRNFVTKLLRQGLKGSS